MIEEKLLSLGITLEQAADQGKPYVKYVRSGSFVWLSGHGPNRGGRHWSGKVGADYTLEEGYAAARDCALNLLATLKTAIGDLDKVRQIVKVFGMVNVAPGFDRIPEVVNGCSDLLRELYGEEQGRSARSAVGMAELPYHMPVEIEMTVEVE